MRLTEERDNHVQWWQHAGRYATEARPDPRVNRGADVAEMSRPGFPAFPIKGPRTEAGAALLAFLLVLLVGGSYALLRDAKSLAQRAKLVESRKTTEALAEAKAALIGYAVSVKLDPACANANNDCPRPGDLPCPDRNNDREAEANCGVQTPAAPYWHRLGRLPTKTLGLSDLRDGAGERLWYAVSRSFRDKSRLACNSLSNSGCLNSDAEGLITVRSSGQSHRKIYDASTLDFFKRNGAIAVIISPGEVLRRQQESTDQNRTCAGGSCNANDQCTTLNPRATPKCHPRNYLDTLIGIQDNQDFNDGTNVANRSNGFIEGTIRDSRGDVIVNDQLLPLTYESLMPLLEARVVGEVLACLRQYEILNAGNYPWAANPSDVHGPGPPPDYQLSDETNQRFGRLPDPPFSNTALGPPGNTWPSGCPILYTGPHTGPPSPQPQPPAGGRPPPTYAQWWFNWKEFVFYGVGPGYEPGGVRNCTAGCLAIDPPSSTPDKRVVVIAAGKRIAAVAGGQPRDDVNKGTLANYLEDQNVTPEDDAFTTRVSGNPPPPFNDVVGYLNVDGVIR